MLNALVVALALAAPADTTSPAAAPRTLADFMLPTEGLPEGCVAIEGEHGVSIQAAVLYSGAPFGASILAKPVAKQAQSMRCGKEEGTVYAYQFATEADAVRMMGFITADIWGEDHPTTMHPERIDRWGDIIVILSFRHPEPIETHLMGRIPGGESAVKAAEDVPPAAKKDFDKGVEAYGRKDYAQAERFFRKVAASIPGNAAAHFYLAHAIFYQEKFRDAIPEYEKARDLAAASGELELVTQRILNDNLGMAYGLTGRLEDAKKHFQAAIVKDPAYPEYYYNLACAQAELGDLDGALVSLKSTYERRGSFLPGESMSNPREDDSFKKYLGNPKFEAALKEMGF